MRARRDQLFSLAARNGVAAICRRPAFARDGGLMEYGNSLTDMYRLVVVYVARILKGEEPADLPVVQSSKFELVIKRRDCPDARPDRAAVAALSR